MKRGLYQVLTYPFIVLTILFLVTVLLSVVVIPEFVFIYDDFDLDLPAATQLLIAVADYLPILLLYAALILSIGGLVTWQMNGVRFVHWICTAIPLFGRAWVWDGQHEFATLMATLVGQKVATHDALTCTADSLRDRNLARAARLANERCDDGLTLSQSLSLSIHFDHTLTLLVEGGEANQTLPKAFREAASTYQFQMDSYVQFLRRVLPPLTLAIVAFTLLFMTAALFIPLVELINGLAG